ncbi:hypothetical protein QE152_g29242 [Popillia japonica]|uniref:Uncharacterized protein n=1 Tax=Popillia japonica TaxID=7064 RepID=A0AAW1JJ13_POPJA
MKVLITCLVITFVVGGNAHPFLRNELIKTQEKRSVDSFAEVRLSFQVCIQVMFTKHHISLVRVIQGTSQKYTK